LRWKSVIVKDGCTVLDGNFSIHSPIINGLCIWSQSDVPHGVRALFAGVVSQKLSLTDWHEHLGHVSKGTLLKFGNSAIQDLDLAAVDSNESTEPCKPGVQGKHHRTPFPARIDDVGNPSNSYILIYASRT